MTTGLPENEDKRLRMLRFLVDFTEATLMQSYLSLQEASDRKSLSRD